MTGAACGAGNAYPSGTPDFTSGFHRGSYCPVICVSLFTKKYSRVLIQDAILTKRNQITILFHYRLHLSKVLHSLLSLVSGKECTYNLPLKSENSQ